jgi:hypothetical protein
MQHNGVSHLKAASHVDCRLDHTQLVDTRKDLEVFYLNGQVKEYLQNWIAHLLRIQISSGQTNVHASGHWKDTLSFFVVIYLCFCMLCTSKFFSLV